MGQVQIEFARDMRKRIVTKVIQFHDNRHTTHLLREEFHHENCWRFYKHLETSPYTRVITHTSHVRVWILDVGGGNIFSAAREVLCIKEVWAHYDKTEAINQEL